MKRTGLLNNKKIKLVLSPPESQLYNQLAKDFTKSSMHGMFEGINLVVALTEIHSKYHISQQKLPRDPSRDGRLEEMGDHLSNGQIRRPFEYQN